MSRFRRCLVHLEGKWDHPPTYMQNGRLPRPKSDVSRDVFDSVNQSRIKTRMLDYGFPCCRIRGRLNKGSKQKIPNPGIESRAYCPPEESIGFAPKRQPATLPLPQFGLLWCFCNPWLNKDVTRTFKQDLVFIG